MVIGKGVDRTLKKLQYQRETTESSSGSFQLSPVSKLELLLEERICSQRVRILSLKRRSLWNEKSLLPHQVTSLKCYYIVLLLRTCVTG